MNFSGMAVWFIKTLGGAVDFVNVFLWEDSLAAVRGGICDVMPATAEPQALLVGR